MNINQSNNTSRTLNIPQEEEEYIQNVQISNGLDEDP